MSKKEYSVPSFVIFIVSLLVSGLILCGAGYYIVFYKLPEMQGDGEQMESYISEDDNVDEISGISQSKVMFDRLSVGLTVVSDTSKNGKLRDQLPSFRGKLMDSRLVNMEVEGWLNIPNTNISYPIPINKSRFTASGILDNEYYLTRTLDLKYAGSYDENAVVFGDSRNSLESYSKMSRNTILYGHNWSNTERGENALKVSDPTDKMFAQLPSFSDLEFARTTQYFTIDLVDEQLICIIFAAAYVDTYNSNNRTGFYYIDATPNDDDFNSIVAEMRRRSEHLYKVPVGPNDKIITLSTCTQKYSSTSANGRFVVMARVLRPEEDLTDFQPPIKNPAPKRPNL